MLSLYTIRLESSPPNPLLKGIIMSSRKKFFLSPDVLHNTCKASLSDVEGNPEDTAPYHNPPGKQPNSIFVNSSLTASQSHNFGRIPVTQNPASPASQTVLFPKSPLRIISARAPQYAESIIDGTLKLHAYLETLECGHQVWTHPQYDHEIRERFVDITSKANRRRCVECKTVSPKKSVVSEKTVTKKEKLA